MDAATFRQDFPEFASATDYPDAQVEFWIAQATRLLPADRWADSLDLGIELFAAHNLVLGRRDQTAAAGGGAPGSAQGPLTSKAVDKVSASYDAGSIALENGAFWNATMYGIRFLYFARLVGAGGVQL